MTVIKITLLLYFALLCTFSNFEKYHASLSTSAHFYTHLLESSYGIDWDKGRLMWKNDAKLEYIKWFTLVI